MDRDFNKFKADHIAKYPALASVTDPTWLIVYALLREKLREGETF